MKKTILKWRLGTWLGLLFAVLGSNVIHAQTTVTLGGPLSLASAIGPMYLNAATPGFLYNRSSFVYQASDLATNGIVTCGTISSLSFWKNSTSATAAGKNFTLRIYMRNTSQGIASTSWSTSGATMVYQNTTQTLSTATGYIAFPFSTTFGYTGGNVEVLVEMLINGGSTTNFMTGACNWGLSPGGSGTTTGYLGQTTSSYGIGISSTAIPTTIGNPRTYVPTIQVAYNAPATMNFDLSVTGMTPGTTGCISGYGKTIETIIKNTGSSTWNFSTNPVEVRGSASGSNPSIFSPVTINSGTLAPNASQTVTMSTNYDMINDTTYRFGFSVNSTADLKPCNDTQTYSRDVLTSFGGSTTMNFDGYNGANLHFQSVSNRKWREGSGITPTGYTSNWLTASNFNGTGNVSAGIALGTPIVVGSADTKRKDWIVGPTFTPNSGDAFEFSAAITDVSSLVLADTMHYDDSVSVMVSTNCGTNWTPIFNITRNQFLTPTFRKYSVPLTAYVGQEIVLAIFANDGPTAPSSTESFNNSAYYFFIDSLKVNTSSGTDLGITQVGLSNNGCSLTNNESVPVRITNFSSTSFTGSIPVQFRINNGTWVNGTSFTGTIAAGSSVSHNINVDLTTATSTFLEVRTNHSLDGNTANNSGYGSTTNMASTNLTTLYSQTFEGLSGRLPSGWYTIDKGNDAVILSSGSYANVWQNSTSGVSQFNCNGTNAASFTSNLASNDEYLYSQCMRMEAGKTYEVTFGYKASSVSSWTTPPKIRVGFSSVQGINSFINEIDTVSNFTSSCQTFLNYFTAPTTGNYYLTFHYFEGNSAGTYYPLNVDDITVRRVNNNDITFVGVVSPETGCSLSATTPVVIRLKNSGVNPIIGGFSVSANYYGARSGSVSFTAAATDTIEPFATKDFTMTSANLSTGGQYTFNFYTTRTGDENTADNNYMGYIAHNTLPIDLALSAMTEDFESGTTLPVGWKVFDKGNDVVVNVRNVFGNQSFAACQGGRSAWFSPTSGIATPNDLIYSRCVNLVNGSQYALGNFMSVSAAWTNAPQVKVGFSTIQDGNTNFDSIIPNVTVTGSTCTYRVDSFTWTKPSGTYYLTYHLFAGNDANNEDLIIDSISLYRLAPCPSPVGLSVVPGSINANATWTNTSSRYKRMAFNISTNSGIPGGGGNKSSALGANTYSFSALSAGTTYYVYARNECNSTYGVSAWVGPITINTKPVNDNCSTATFIPVTLNTTCTNNVLVSNMGATASTTGGTMSCGTSNSGNVDIWYKTVVPGSGRFVVKTGQFAGSNLTDPIINAYTGTCAGTLTSVGCNDDDAAGGTAHSRLVLSGLNPNDTVLVRVTDFNGASTGKMYLCLYDSMARDLGVTAVFVSNNSPGNYSTPSTVNATIKNFGPIAYNGSVSVSYTENGVVKATQSFALTNFAVGATQNVAFTTTWTTSTRGARTLSAYTSYGSDISRLNDTSFLYLTNFGTTLNASWVKSLQGTSNDESGLKMAYDNNNNAVYAAGGFYNFATIATDTLRGKSIGEAYLVKFDTTGNLLWSRVISGLGKEQIAGIKLDNSGNVFVTGTFSKSLVIGNITISGLGSQDGFIAKYDPNGSVLWAVRFGNSGSENVSDMTIDQSGSKVTIVGSFNGNTTFGTNNFTSGGDLDLYVVQYNGLTGSVNWAYTSPGAQADFARGVTTDFLGNIYVTGALCNNKDIQGPFNLTSSGIYNMFVAKLNASGTLVWARSLSGAGSEIGNHILVNNNDEVMVVGQFDYSIAPLGTIFRNHTLTAGSNDIFYAKWNSIGTLMSLKTAGGAGNDFPTAFIPDGAHLIVSGFIQNDANIFGSVVNGAASGDGFVLNMDANNNVRYITKTSGNDVEIVNGICNSSAGSIYVTGNYYGNATVMGTSVSAPGQNDAYFARLGGISPMNTSNNNARIAVLNRSIPVTNENLIGINTEWYDVKATSNQGKLDVQWKVSTELEHSTFFIEQWNGQQWMVMGSMEVGVNHTVGEPYHWTTSMDTWNGDQLRIRMHNENGLYANSYAVDRTTVENTGAKNTLTMSVYPNPAHDQVSILFSETPASSVVISLTTIDGKVVQQWSMNQSNRFMNLSLPMVAEGVYFLKMNSDSGTSIQKITIK
jgi:hypothetical protein